MAISDHGIEKLSKMDVMPPREQGALELSAFQSESLKQSMGHIERLEQMFESRSTSASPSTSGQHCVAYIVAFNTLVHNPMGVEHFVNVMERIAVKGVVDKKIIPGLAKNVEGEEVGVFLHLDVYASV